MKKFILKTSKIIASAFAMTMIYTGIASAHVVVNPKISTPGAWETYTMKVPSEKEIPTTKVTLKIPSKFEFVSYQPVSGWKFTETKDANGVVTSVTWSAENDGIQAGQFQQFVFMAKNPDAEVNGAWDAYQYYKDGSIVEWTGDEKSEAPHSITNIVKDTTVKGENVKATENTTVKKDTEKSGSSNTSLVMSIVAAVLSVIALLVAILRKK
ncbi:YcnI family copper-binding membrane protein [Gottfriedia acidiceleris]|uniref:YcnI family copper-binding membrane protein n=1 Tax=Gottfriedia acidiceleris TaxID=371036 RepID=UPI002FFD7488